MDQILGFIKEMTPFQWVLIGGGIVILWPYISKWFSNIQPKPPEPKPEPTPPPIPDDYTLSLLRQSQLH